MEKKTFSIPTISCGPCVNAIKTELTELTGISKVEGDIEAKVWRWNGTLRPPKI